jgi:long-chain-alcohol oxidase
MEGRLKKLGWHVDMMPRAVRGCSQDEHCGYCGFGCRIGAKQSTMRTYLEEAATHGLVHVAGVHPHEVQLVPRERGDVGDIVCSQDAPLSVAQRTVGRAKVVA